MLKAFWEGVVWWLGVQEVEVSVVRVGRGLGGDVRCWFFGWDLGVWEEDVGVVGVWDQVGLVPVQNDGCCVVVVEDVKVEEKDSVALMKGEVLGAEDGKGFCVC